MGNRRLFGLCVVVVLLAVGLAGCAAGSTATPVEVKMNSQQVGIWVSGEGKVTAVPDVATISLGISAQADNVSTAQSQASTAMDKVMKALADNGVAKKDIKTQQFNITQVTRWDNVKQVEITTGYRVTNMVTAKIRDIGKAGTVIDAVAAAGGDLTRINNIAFSIDDPTSYKNDARQKALADAKARAEQIAKLAGVTLGKPTYITESSYIPGPVIRADIAKAAPVPAPAAPPTEISAGEQEITVNVQVTYSIQ